MKHGFSMTEGRAAPLGASFGGDGVNFAVFSENSTRMELCLYSEDGKAETVRLDLPERDGDVLMASGTPPYAETGQAIFAIFNAGPARVWQLPVPPDGMAWHWQIDTARPDFAGGLAADRIDMPGDAVAAFVLKGTE